MFVGILYKNLKNLPWFSLQQRPPTHRALILLDLISASQKKERRLFMKKLKVIASVACALLLCTAGISTAAPVF